MGIKPLDIQFPPRPMTPEHPNSKTSLRSAVWQRVHRLFGRDDDRQSSILTSNTGTWSTCSESTAPKDPPSRRIDIGLPRQTTFKRQNSEKRDRLCAIEPCSAEKRAVSHSRQTSISVSRPRARSSPPPTSHISLSAPTISEFGNNNLHLPSLNETLFKDVPNIDADIKNDFPPPTNNLLAPVDFSPDEYVIAPAEADRCPRPPSTTSSSSSQSERLGLDHDKAEINAELDQRWILNLSMHFRDKSDREKFFVTYAETPNKWRRVTISCDYRNAEPGSLEMDLKELQFQRDKSMQIYESIRDSLKEIQFYDTVTNLKLETSDGRLHVHVTEDVNEIIPYPPRATVAHILDDEEYRPKEVLESELTFDSHLSGFVYKVDYRGTAYIKKEIPGPDTVDEFLYEINALHALSDSKYVIKLEGIVLDDYRQTVKGLLIGFAERGAIVDLLYDHHGTIPWEHRLRWARNIVYGLSDIHAEGYVQGDFTLSNIVVDANGDALIIDINRRGCPVGWEPPEIARKIASHQRISMYIGEKTDIYQLGMTLWALAADDDEPERHDPPLRIDALPEEIPNWYKEIVQVCLESQPRDRLSVKELKKMFPTTDSELQTRLSDFVPQQEQRKIKTHDASEAIGLDDIQRLAGSSRDDRILYSPESSQDDYTFTYPRSSNYERESDVSEFERPRGRQPPTNVGHLTSQDRRRWADRRSLPRSYDEEDAQIVAISPGGEPDYDEIDLDGKPFLIARNTFSDEEMQILERRAQEDNETKSDEANSKRRGVSSDILTSKRNSTDHKQLLAGDKVSATSSSTPRTSEPFLHNALSEAATNPQLNMQSAALNGIGDHVASSQTPDFSSDDVRTQDWDALALPQPPPSLPYADSGYDEPLNFADLDEISQQHETPHDNDASQSIQPAQGLAEQSCVPTVGDVLSTDNVLPANDIFLSHAEHEGPETNTVASVASVAPPLLRSATANKIGRDTSPIPSQMEEGSPATDEAQDVPASLASPVSTVERTTTAAEQINTIAGG